MGIPTSPVSRLAAFALALVAAYAGLQVYPHDLRPAGSHPDLLAAVFYDRAMVFTGRIAILSIAAFAVLSIAARIWNREWLTKAGPFEVARAAATSESERGEERARAAESVVMFEALRTRAARSDADVVVLNSLLTHLLEELKGARDGSE